MTERAPPAQTLPAGLAVADLGDRNSLDRAGIARVARVIRPALGVRASVTERGLVPQGLEGGLTGVDVGTDAAFHYPPTLRRLPGKAMGKVA